MNSGESEDDLFLAGSFLETNTANTTQGPLPHTDKIVSEATVFYFKLLVHVFLCGLVSIVGIIVNIINIIVFVRQGIFTENGSASLLSLAVADFCCVASMLWLSISKAIVLADPPDLLFNPRDVAHLTGGWPHLMFAQITRMVTAYVAFERCICVVFPFKVKSIFTPRRSIIAIASIFVCFALSHSPVWITQRLEYKLDPVTNSTRLVLVSHPQWQLAVDVMYYVNSITFNIGAVLIVLVCSMITVSRVKLSKTWRKSVTNDTASNPSEKNISGSNLMPKSKMQKEKKLVRMITLISVIFLVCYIPELANLTIFIINPDIRIPGKQENLAMVMYSFTFLLETVNSSINILVYYSISSRYKQIFKDLFKFKT